MKNQTFCHCLATLIIIKQEQQNKNKREKGVAYLANAWHIKKLLANGQSPQNQRPFQ